MIRLQIVRAGILLRLPSNDKGPGVTKSQHRFKAGGYGPDGPPCDLNFIKKPN